jgi:hypothetical protein
VEVAIRVAKAFVIAIVTFGSVWAISGSVKIGSIAALVPLILGSLAILSEFAYALAALSLITAVVLQIVPQEWVEAGRRLGGQVVTEILKKTSNSN